MAHTLDFKTASDTDLTDDDYECESLTAKLEAEANNNNNVEDTDYKIDSVNRLDSVENIQKVFYDKPVFNAEEDSEFNQISESSSGNSNNHSDEDTEIHVDLNIKLDKKVVCHDNIVGDFSKEVQDELGKVTLYQTTDHTGSSPELPKLAKAVVRELEEAVEKLKVMKDLQPPVTKYNIEPNIENHFTKLSPSKQLTLHTILNDSEVVKNSESEMKETQIHADPIKTKIQDAFLSDAKENLMPSYSQENIVEPEIKMEVDDAFKKQELVRKDSNRELLQDEHQTKKIKLKALPTSEDAEKFCKENVTKEYKEKEEDSVIPRKKEKVELAPIRKRRDYNQQFGSWITVPRREMGARNRDPMNRRSVPMTKDKKKSNHDALGKQYDVLLFCNFKYFSKTCYAKNFWLSYYLIYVFYYKK